MKTFIFILCCFGFIAAKGQTSPILQISGQLKDSLTQQPVPYATLLLKNEKKVQVKSAISNKEGVFTLANVTAGNYIMNIVHVGYQSKNIAIKLEGTSKVLPTISLLTGANQLKGVTVMADRPLVKQEIDRIAYDVKADPESKVNNVLEMMRKVPLLSVDGEDNIQLQGNSNYKILINGKPSGMMERNPKDILKSMPASSIERIEVITTPPAKYDGEGLAGIINIITFKKADNGTNGTVNVSERFPVGGPGIGGTFTLKNGKFGLATNVGGNLSGTPDLISTNSRIINGSKASNLWQTGNKDFSGKSGYAGVELSYELDSLNLISGQFNYNANKNDGFNSQYSLLNGATIASERYELNNNSINSGHGIDAAFNYQLGFKKDKNRLLTFSYRYFEFSNSQNNNVDIFNTLNYNLPDYQQDNKGSSSEQTVQVDLAYPLKKVNIEAGVKAIFRNNSSDFQYLSANSSGAFIIDPTLSNAFNNLQNVYGIYNTYQFNIQKWAVKAGVRLEKTDIDADFVGSTFSNNSLNVIPSISMMKRFKNQSSINFGFTSRIQRPGINQLNPFEDRSNPNIVQVGNPDLKPMKGNSIEMSYSSFKKLNININARGMFFNNVIMPRITTENNVTKSSYGNTGDATLIGLNINANYPINPKLRVNAAVMGNYGIVSGEINNVTLKKRGLMRRAMTAVSYRPTKDWQTSASVNYNGPGLSLQGTSNSFVFYSLSVNKDFLNNKLTLSFAANNMFNKYRNAINYTNGTDFTQESFNQNYQRGFTTSLNYRFGRLKENIKKNKKGIDNNDVSGGTL
jgi:ferric enterobactin receptor